MSFNRYEITDYEKGAIGQINPNFSNLIETVTFDYKTPLNIGRVAQYKDGILCNMDATTTPTIAGVVTRSVTNAVESGDTYVATGDEAVYQVDVLDFGLVNVAVADGVTPLFKESVYVVTSGENAGKVTTEETTLKLNGEFRREIQTGIWEIFIK